jgi:hypothetical protein
MHICRDSSLLEPIHPESVPVRENLERHSRTAQYELDVEITHATNDHEFTHLGNTDGADRQSIIITTMLAAFERVKGNASCYMLPLPKKPFSKTNDQVIMMEMTRYTCVHYLFCS